MRKARFTKNCYNCASNEHFGDECENRDPPEYLILVHLVNTYPKPLFQKTQSR